MKAYLQAFINFKQNDLVQLLPIIEYAYNNTKNASTRYTPIELNCRYLFLDFLRRRLWFLLIIANIGKTIFWALKSDGRWSTKPPSRIKALKASSW